MKEPKEPIELNHKLPRNHMGFYDANGTELHIGDEIIVHQYNRSYHAVVVRFTPRRVYWKVLKAPDWVHDAVFNWVNFSQLHLYYGTGNTYAAPENTRSLRSIIKLEDPVYVPARGTAVSLDEATKEFEAALTEHSEEHGHPTSEEIAEAVAFIEEIS